MHDTTLYQRLLDRSSIVGNCREWGSALHPYGYGTFRYLGKSLLAHRAMYIAVHGPIPDGMCVCHACDNPPCIQPSHLWLGTKKDNTADMFSKDRGRQRLTQAQRRMIAVDPRPTRVVAAEYGCSISRVNTIKRLHLRTSSW